MSEQNPEQPRTRIYWVPHAKDSAAPTAEELAAGVPLDGWAVVDDGLQLAQDDAETPQLLPEPRTYTIVRRPDGTFDAIAEDYQPDWIVFRPALGVLPEQLPRGIDGWWLDRRGLPADGLMIHQSGAILHFAPTGRFEERDGVVAEVYEVQP
ncbi:hypothetical protein AB0O28_18915 [Microbispora sp. NPDC088329]|uniref:phage tail tube protein n=1 Tax=Microbispora sp. NPDC088329 TaxID=3154869 RepID=UPI003423ED35